MLKDKVNDLAGRIHRSVVADRRHIHMNPELSFKEEQTGVYIQSELRKIGIPYTKDWAGHGVVGIVEGGKSDSAVLALRADIDALPIQEDNNVEYKSRNPGIMHACGHDVHTSSLLGVARILYNLRNHFNGTVKLIFQPGEEKLPGGASIMIEEGVLEKPVPKEILGQHVYPLLPAGHVGFRPGQYMASADEISLTVKGRGGHGAVPQSTIDPIAISALIISALQQLVSRLNDPTMPSVLTFGKIVSDGGTYNVIPGDVKMLGTFRTFDEVWRTKAHDKIREISQGIATGFGAHCEVDINVGYPFLVNDVDLTNHCMTEAQEFLGENHVHQLPLRMAAEDFSYYTHHIPGCFYRLGVANTERNINSSVHTPTFDIDESALITGPALMSWLTIARLSEFGS
jgi:amidohydrolase